MRWLLRERRYIFIPLLALVFLFTLYYRETTPARSDSSAVYLPPTNAPPLCSQPDTEDQHDVLLPHKYRDDGIIEVNPDGSHPIFELIKLANSRWQTKLSKASKTLEQAVNEYVRRYKRRPPKGFEEWWDYVQTHNVQLPDEYDQIYRDLEPFWGYSPHDIKWIQREQEDHQDSFTLGHNETGEIDILKVSFGPSNGEWNSDGLLHGARATIELLKEVQHAIPHFRAVISPHDNPGLFAEFEVKEKLLDAAERKSYVDVHKLTEGENLGWLSGCSPSSPARQGKKLEPRPPHIKTFIVDHRKTMDPCFQPQHLEHVGEFLMHERPGRSRVMVPRFAYCATSMHYDIQLPTITNWMDDVLPRSDDLEWDEKLDERLNWRGTNTGMWHAPTTHWRSSQRARLIDLVNRQNGTVKVLIPPRQGKRVGEGMSIPLSKLNPAITDIAFAGSPVGCHEETCPELKQIYEWRKQQGSKESGNFKYILDVDGNAWSSRFKRLITTNSLIFKATVYPEWFYDRIEPWVHYVPVQVDYSDLYDTLAFFRGGLYGEGGHPDLARKIAMDGRTWSRSFWRKEDVTAYVYRLMLEYARIMSPDRETMTYNA